MFSGPEHPWMVSFRVRDLDAMVRRLEPGDIAVEVDPEEYPNGRFAQLADRTAPPSQLWQPSGANAPDRRDGSAGRHVVHVRSSGLAPLFSKYINCYRRWMFSGARRSRRRRSGADA